MNDEDQLAAAFAAHADGALEEAYHRQLRCAAAVGRTARPRRGRRRAHDCVHDALIRVWSRGGYRPERGALRAFLVVCVRNEAISRRRSATRQVALERRVATEDVDEGLDPAERITIQTALATLPREQRDVIELAYWGRFTQAEIADRLAVPLGTIKSRASLGLRKLARTLAPQG